MFATCVSAASWILPLIISDINSIWRLQQWFGFYRQSQLILTKSTSRKPYKIRRDSSLFHIRNNRNFSWRCPVINSEWFFIEIGTVKTYKFILRSGVGSLNAKLMEVYCITRSLVVCFQLHEILIITTYFILHLLI